MLKCFKTEIQPTELQKQKIHKTIGVCRFVYNFYLSKNQELYKETGEFLSAYDFSKWLNNEFIPNNLDYVWIKEVSSKAVKISIMNAEKAYKNFFKGKSKFPKYKKKHKHDVKMPFVKNSKTDLVAERHRIKIPTLGWVRLKEFNYIPTDSSLRSGTVSIHAGRYYVSVLADVPDKIQLNDIDGIGIDLGVKDFATISTGQVYKNINKTQTIKTIERRLKHSQRSFSRKLENKKKGETVYFKNIEKNKLEIQRLNQRLQNTRKDYINKIVSNLVKTKPAYITIEDLNIRGMLKNRHLSKAIQQQNFYYFRQHLVSKCREYGIEVRLVDRFYPSSKTCHNCGTIKSDLKLSDRTYICDCGYSNDRDLNAALNLRDAKVYKIA